MSEEDLIIELSQALTPYRPWPRWQLQLFVSVVFIAIYSACVVWWADPRDDWQALLTHPFANLFEYVETLLLIGLMVTALQIALILRVPDQYQIKPYLGLPRLLFLGVVLTVIVRFIFTADVRQWQLDIGPCLIQLLAAAALPAVVGYYVLRRQASVARGRLAEMLAWSALAVSALCLKLTCDITATSHVVLAHYLPIVCVAAIIIPFGPRLFAQWDRH